MATQGRPAFIPLLKAGDAGLRGMVTVAALNDFALDLMVMGDRRIPSIGPGLTIVASGMSARPLSGFLDGGKLIGSVPEIIARGRRGLEPSG